MTFNDQDRWIRIRGNGPGPRLLISAGVHGDEWEPMAAVWQLKRKLEELAFRGSAVLCPVVNTSAYQLGQRCGADQLDLARTCPGDPAGSETQRAADELSREIQRADFYIDLHTGGIVYDVWPLVGYMLHPQQDVLQHQRAMAKAFNLPLIWGTDADLPGRSLSVARDAGVPAIYAEYHGGRRWDGNGVTQLVSGCLAVMAELGMHRPGLVDRKVRYLAEDPRPGAGHMQVCYPAPHDGVFVPRVVLGHFVRRGEALGWIHDMRSGQMHEVQAEQDGLLVVLRALPRVHVGDSLAVMIDQQLVRDEAA